MATAKSKTSTKPTAAKAIAPAGKSKASPAKPVAKTPTKKAPAAPVKPTKPVAKQAPPPAKPVAKAPVKKAPPPPAKPVGKTPAKKAAPPPPPPAKKAAAKKAAPPPPPPAKKTAAKKAAPPPPPAKKTAAKKAAPPPPPPAKKAAAKKAAPQVERASAPVVHTPSWPEAAAPAAPPAPPARRTPAPLSAEQEETLRDLGADFARGIDRAAGVILEEARELEAAVAGKADRLLRNTRLTQDELASLGGRVDALAAAEAAWTTRFHAELPAALRPVLDEAASFKRDAIAALRYFLEDDADVQHRVDALAASNGVPALAHDLQTLADLVHAHGAALKHAGLPERAAGHARELADVLTAEATADATSAAAKSALELRNRAFWHLREAMDAIRSAGRYAFRTEPAALAVYRAAPVRAPLRTRHASAAE